MKQLTLSILKPDVLRNGLSHNINNYIIKAGLEIKSHKALLLNEKQASEFYAMHKEAPFFKDLIKFMTSGPIIAQVLSGTDAIKCYRELMGHTDPQKASKGTIRGDFANSIDENCVHGSDSAENAEREIAFFFAKYELLLN